MNQKKFHTVLFAIYLALITGLAIFGIFNFISFIVKLLPFIVFITPLFYLNRMIRFLKWKHTHKKITSESIFQKRFKRFKSIKRGYYSLIILGLLYLISLLGPLWMNNKPLVVSFANEKYDDGENFKDLNNNGLWDEGETFIDQRSYYFPAIRDFFSSIPWVSEARYSAEIFNQEGRAVVDFRKLKDSLDDSNSNNYIIMPFYPYHPHEDLSDELDEKFEDKNINGQFDEGCGILLQLNLDSPATKLSNINITGSNGDNLDFVYYNHKNIISKWFFWLYGMEFEGQACDLPNFNLYINDSNQVYYNSSENISSIQFDIEGANLQGVSKYGDAIESEFTISTSNQTVLGISNDILIQTQEPYNDENDNGKYDTYNPPTKPGDSQRHLLGTETSGKDVFTRLVDGYKISITFAIVVTTLSYIIGVIIGAFLGYFGGKWDLFGVRLIEIFSSIPFLFVLMILAGFMKPGVFLLALLAVILKGWIGITMYIRGEFFREKPKDYVSAAVSMGQSNSKIMFKHILPNSLTPIITFAPFSIIGDIFTLVSLDFLGYGLKPPASSWGALLKQGSENLLEWHLLVFPVIVLTITIFMITFISEAVREAFDPRVYSRLR